MDRDTLQRKLQQALLDKDHEKELRMKALIEKESLQKDLLDKEIEIGNLQTDVKSFSDTVTKIRLKQPDLFDSEWSLDDP